MKKAQKRFFGTALTLSTVASVVAPVAVSAATQTYEDAKAKVDAAKATPVFSLFNTAYEAAMNLTNKDQQAELLSQLAPLWDKVNTPYVQEVLAKMEALAKDKNLKTYHELMAMIDANSSEATNKAYLGGELYAWGTSGALYTADEKAAIDAINKAWTAKTPEAIAAAKTAAAKVTNAGSLEWLNGQITEVQATLSLTITELKATGAKELSVKFNKAIDTTKAVVEVKKGSIVVGNTATYADDKASVKLALNSKITEGEYTVTVKGVDTKDLVAKVTTADEKIADIKILSEVAVATVDKATNEITKVQVNYKVSNQYGEDITKNANVLASAGLGLTTDLSVDSANGRVVIDNLQALSVKPRIGDKFAVSIINADSANSTASASAVVTISNSVNVSTISVSKLYNTDSKILNEDSTASDFMLVLDVKDQYGNLITDANTIGTDLVASSSNTWVVGVNTDNATGSARLENVYINGVKQVVLRLANNTQNDLNAGKATITLISKSTGKNAQFEVEVKTGKKVSKITLSQPDLAIAEEAVNVPITAYDAEGNILNDLDTINDISNGAYVSASNNVVSQPIFVKDAAGNTFIQIVPSAKGYVNLTVQARDITNSTGVANININVKEKAVPTSIDSVSVGVNGLIGEQVQVDYDDIKYIDQYGRAFVSSTVKPFLTGTAAVGNYRVKVTTNGSIAIDTNAVLTPVTENGAGIITNANKVTYTVGTTATAGVYATGVGNVTLQLQKYENGAWKNVSGGDYSVQARGVDIKDVKSFEVADLGKMLDETGLAARGKVAAETTNYDKTFQVKGKLSDGSTILIPAIANNVGKEYYNVTTNSTALEAVKFGVKFITKTGEDLSKYYLNANGTFDYGTDEKVTTLTTKVQVTLNHDGTRIIKDLVIAKDAPTITKVAFADDATYVDGTIIDNVDTGSIIKVNLTSANFATFMTGAIVQVYDQYGKDFKLNVGGTPNINQTTGVINNGPVELETKLLGLTFSNKSRDGIVIANNGTRNATISSLVNGDSFDVSFTFDNGMTAVLKVVVNN